MIRKFTEKITGIRYDGEKHGGLYGVLLYIGENMIQLSIL